MAKETIDYGHIGKRNWLHTQAALNRMFTELYSGSANSQYIYFTNPVTGFKIRVGNRGDQLMQDKELILNGFAQDLGAGQGEGVGWENIGGAI